MAGLGTSTIIGLAAVMLALGLAGYLGLVIGRQRERNWWYDEMIRRRHMVYHWENGKIYWNEDEPQTSRDPAATKVQRLMSQ